MRNSIGAYFDKKEKITMNKSAGAAIISILGFLLAFISGIVWYAYETGYSYVVSPAEELAIINKAQICFWVGLIMFIIGVTKIIKTHTSD